MSRGKQKRNQYNSEKYPLGATFTLYYPKCYLVKARFHAKVIE